MRTQPNIDRPVGGNLITLPKLSAVHAQPSVIRGGSKTTFESKAGKRRANAIGRKAQHGTQPTPVARSGAVAFSVAG